MNEERALQTIFWAGGIVILSVAVYMMIRGYSS